MEADVIEIVDEASEVCPVCELLIISSLIQTHVDNHFKHDTATSILDHAKKRRICRKCGNNVLELEWADHFYAHELQETKVNANVAVSKCTTSNTGLSNQGCSSEVNGDEMNDSILACVLQQEEEEIKRQKEKEEKEFERLQTLYGMNSKSGYGKQYKKLIDKDISKNKLSIADYYSQKENMLDALITGEESGESCTEGVIERLQRLCSNPCSGKIAVFCLPTNHYSTSYGDKNWGCGYRNLQMLLSSLLKLDNLQTVIQKVCKKVPSIPKIQQIIEDAWKAGYDNQGASQLGNKLTKTKKWIGATEIAVALRFIGLRAKIVDFHCPTSEDGTHPEMFCWIKEYFNQNKCSLTHNTSTPLYLQHQGHSRSVVGYEEKMNKNKNKFLMLFDPSHSKKQMQALCQTEKLDLKLIRKSLKQMHAQQYQIVYVDGIMNEKEQEESKNVTSVRIP